MSLVIKKINDIDKKLIDNFLKESIFAWFQHSYDWIKYTVNMHKSNSIDLSFVVFQNNILVALVPLVKEPIKNFEDKNQLSMSGFPTVYPAILSSLSINNVRKLEKIIFKKIFKIIEEQDISYVNIYISPLSDGILKGKINANPLLKFGFNDTSISTNILMLNKDILEIFNSFSDTTKNKIRYAETNKLHTTIFDQQNINSDIFNKYKNIHLDAAGRKTRPEKTWDIMYQWIKDGKSILAITFKDKKEIAGQIINTFNKKAYFQSGATLPEYSTFKGTGHYAHWKIIQYLHSINFTNYEIGWNWYNGISEEVADIKMQSISQFKRSFGAEIYPVFRGEWFKEKELMKKIYLERIEYYFKR